MSRGDKVRRREMENMPVVCRPEPVRSAYVQSVRIAICDETAAACARSYGERLRAIVLTGSLARDEATISAGDHGYVLLGDADLLVVFHHSPEPDSRELDRIATAVETELAAQSIVAHISIGSVLPSYFGALPPHSFTYELRTCGRVIWGDTAILDLIPDYDPTQLSREDAWRTLNNRIIELLACFRRSLARPDRARQYAALKLYLDSAMSYLIFAGQYEPTYSGRAERLRVLSEAEIVCEAPYSLPEFYQRVSECTQWKLSGIPPTDAESREFIENVIHGARQLWVWEATKLAGAGSALPIRSLVYAIANQQSAMERIRGWASLLRRSGWVKSWRHWPRWLKLARHATPRYLVYAVAAEAFQSAERLHSAPNSLWHELGNLLPQQQASVQSWSELLENVVWNYERFLASTRA